MHASLRNAAGLCLVALSLSWTLPAVAEPSTLPPEIGYNYNELDTPRSAAMSGALRAVSSSTDALFINPANMAYEKVYHLGIVAQIWPEAGRQSYGAAAVDSIVSRSGLAGGVGFTWTRQDPEGLDRTAQDLRFALAYPFSKQFLFGVGGRYLSIEQNGDGPLGTTVATGLRDETIAKDIALDVGATLRPTEGFSIAVVGNNVNDPGGFQPASAGGGVGFGNRDFTLEVDVLADFTTWDTTTTRAMAGLEFLAAGKYPLRGGYRWDEGAQSHSVSGGLGYVDKQLSAEIAVRRVVSGDTSTAVIFGFKYHLESAGITPTPGGW